MKSVVAVVITDFFYSMFLESSDKGGGEEIKIYLIFTLVSPQQLPVYNLQLGLFICIIIDDFT